MQIFQILINLLMVLFNVFGPLLRLFGHIITSVPGSKSVLKFIPFLNKTEKQEDVYPCGKRLVTYIELKKEFLRDPEVSERRLLEKMSPLAREMYLNNKVFNKFQHSQPNNTQVTVRFK